MDAVGLEILEREMTADCQILADAAGKASQRVREAHPGHLEACAYEVARFYTVFERMLEVVTGQQLDAGLRVGGDPRLSRGFDLGGQGAAHVAYGFECEALHCCAR